MKLLGCVLVLWALVGVISGANIEKRGNVGAALGIGLNVAATTPPARPTIPSWINTLTSNLFNQNETTGMSPIYGFLKQLTSNIFPFLANTTYGILAPFNNLINTFTFNLYHGLCAPPSPKPPVAGQTAAPGMPTTTTTSAPASSNPITNIINLLLGNGGTTGTGATDPLSQLLAALGGTASNQATSTSNLLSTIIGALGNHFGNDASSIQSLLNALGGIITGATGNTGTGLPSLFPGVTVTGGVNLTLNVSPQLLSQYLSSFGQTIQTLQAALNSLGWTAQNFVQGLAANGGDVLAYLQSIFAKLANPPTTATGSTGVLGGLFPGVTVTGSVNTTLNLSPQAFSQLLASMTQTIPTLQAALNTLSGTAQQFVDGLAAYQGDATAYLKAIFAAALQNTGSGATNTLQGIVNGLLNGLNNILGQPVLDLLGNLLGALGLGK